MPLAMMITVVGTLLSAVLAAMLAGQIGTTRSAVSAQHALDAAQAALDIATGHIRDANDGTGNGVLAELPCGPFSGTVGVSGRASYVVTVAYTLRNGDPVGCLAGGGTRTAPAYAQLRATGTDVATGYARRLDATYKFRTTNENIPGGLIRVFKTATSQDLCLDAGSTSPAAGVVLTVQLCSSGSDQQTFAYNRSLTITLVSSISGSRPLGMCLDAGSVPHAVSGVPVRLQPCAATTQPRQQWSFNDVANFEGTSDGATLDGYCFNVEAPDVAGSAVVLKNGANCRQFGYDNVEDFSPEAAVGAGAAGAPNSQLVNYAQFGRCLDVTRQDWTFRYMIAWPCKQAPNPSNVLWNQKWITPPPTAGLTGTTGVISTKPTATAYRTCLKSPLSTAPGQFVILAACPVGAPPLDMTWTVYGDTGTYDTSYTIVDGSGNCLAAADPDDPDTELLPEGQRVSSVVVIACSGTTLAKWNADPEVLAASPLKDIKER